MTPARPLADLLPRLVDLPSSLLITSQRPLPGLRSELEPLPLEVATDSLLRRACHPDAAVARTAGA